jgi:aldehyde decarbonylase
MIDLQIWLVGDGWKEDEQLNALKGTLFIPFSQFPPKKMRKDCFFYTTPAMITPISLINMHSCEVRNQMTNFII